MACKVVSKRRCRCLQQQQLQQSSSCHAPQLLLLLLVSQHALMAVAAATDWTTDREASVAAAAKHAEHHWRSSMHRLKSLKLNDHALGDFLRHVMQHQYTLPLEQMQKSLVYTGSNYRLRKLVHDLILGTRPIKVGAIGGSITHGAKASSIGETDWFSLVGKYMRTAFPRASISTRNGALPATPSALMNMCLEQYVDSDVDLVFVEYVANDGANRYDEVKPKVYERLLRKLLNRPSRPAVVLLQLMPKGMAFGPGRQDKVPFFATLEDVYGAQAQYYDLPWLSFRNAMWRLSELHVHGHNWTDFMWDVDFMHPIDPGMAAISDMVVHLLQQTGLSLLLNPLSRADRTLLSEPLPQPMYNGNWEAKNLMCTYGEGLKPLVDAAGSKGWDFVDEGKPGAPKWGYVSRQPGSVLKIKLDSRQEQGGTSGDDSSDSDESSGSSGSGQLMSVMLAYLKSYEGMGMASFECTSSCTCEPRQDIDALHELRQSTIYLVRLLVTQAKDCEITVRLSDKTRCDGHKFKVSGIMMNGYIGADVTEKLHEEQWLTQFQATARGGAERAVGSSSGSDGSGSSGSARASTAAAAADGQSSTVLAGPTTAAAAAAAEESTAVAAGKAEQQEGAASSGSSEQPRRRRQRRLQQQGQQPGLWAGAAAGLKRWLRRM